MNSQFTKRQWILKVGYYITLSLLIQISCMKKFQQINSKQKTKMIKFHLQIQKLYEQMTVKRVLTQSEIKKVSGGPTTPTFTQRQPVDYSTIQFILKMDNHGTQAQLQAATTFTIDGVETNFTVSYSHGVFWLFIVEMTPSFTSSSCIDLTFQYSLMTGFSKAPYQGLSCMNYVQYEEPTNNSSSTNQTNNQNQTISQNQTNDDTPYEQQILPTAFQQGTADSAKSIAAGSSLLFKGSLALGAQNLLISLLTFLNLIVLYYFLPVQLPDNISLIFKYVLNGATSNIFLPEDSFQFLSTTKQTDEIYSQLSISRNFLSLFSENIILFVVFSIIKRIVDRILKKWQDPSYKYSQLIFFTMYTIGSLPLIVFSGFLHLQRQIQFINIIDKFNMSMYIGVMVIAMCAIICFFLLINRSQSSDIFSQLYMGINHKQNNLHAKEMAFLQIIAMVTIPALILVDIRVFWVINFIIISKQIYRLIDYSAFQSKLTHFIKCINKTALFVNHCMFSLYYFLSSQQHSQALSILSTIHFFSIFAVILLETLNFIVQIAIQVIQKIRQAWNNSVVSEPNQLKIKDSYQINNSSQIKNIEKTTPNKLEQQKKYDLENSDISQIQLTIQQNNKLQKCQIQKNSKIKQSNDPIRTKQSKTLINNNKISDIFNNLPANKMKYNLSLGPIKKKKLPKLQSQSIQKVPNRTSFSILDNQQYKEQNTQPYDIKKLKLKSAYNFKKTHIKKTKTIQDKQKIRIQQIKKTIQIQMFDQEEM